MGARAIHTTKAEATARLRVRRGYSEVDAAAYIGISASKFRELVKAGRMPRPRLLDSRRIWDIDDLDDAFKALPRDGEDEVDTWADVGN